jgi:hypothetical protein
MRLTKLSILQELKELKKYKTVEIPSQMELLLLSSNLLYKSKMIMDREMTAPKDLTALNYTYEAINLMDAVDKYETHYLTNKEIKEIKKKYKLNDLYK